MMNELRLKATCALVLAFISCSLTFTTNVEAKSDGQDTLRGATPRLINGANRRDERIEIISERGIESHEIEVYVPDATFIKLHFNKFKLPPGLVIEVSNPYGTESYRYSSSKKDGLTFDPRQGDDGVNSFSAMSISGDTAVIRVLGNQRGRVQALAHNVEVDYFMEGLPESLIDESSYGVEAASSIKSMSSGGKSHLESRCGGEDREDAVCWADSDPTEFDRSRPVAKLLIDGSKFCTAWRVGSGNHLLTNSHCMSDQADTTSTEVWFDYQNEECRVPNVSSGLVKVAANTLLKSSAALDYTLFTVNQFEAVSGFGYLGLDIGEVMIGNQIYIPQHGGGYPKQVSIDSDMNVSGRCEIDGVNLNGFVAGTDVGYFCDTSAGSSGSPVLSAETHLVVAIHHFGGCMNQGVNISTIWPEIAEFFGNLVPTGDDAVPTTNYSPQAQFSIDCAGLYCEFDASSSIDIDGSISDYGWSLGDGSSANGMTISHNFGNGGLYDVVLTVQDNEGATDQKANTISLTASNASPVAVFLVQCNQGVCDFNATASYDTDGTVSWYHWDFGDGSIVDNLNAFTSHEYISSGNYLARLTVSDNFAATGNAESWVSVAIDPVVNADPSAEFTFDCQELSCTFNASASNDPDGFISAYHWSFGDGSDGDGELVSHTFNADGTYEVTLNVSDNGEASSFVTKPVQVASPVSNTLQLSVTGEKYKGSKTAQLHWSGAVSANVDILRDGELLTTTENDGEHTDSSVPNRIKSASYQVCQPGRLVCSDEVDVKF